MAAATTEGRSGGFLSGRVGWALLPIVVTAVVLMVMFFLMFEVWFKVPLFKGMYDLLSFLGY